MTVSTKTNIITSMKLWKEDLLQEQGERQRRLKSLEEYLEILNEKVQCLLSVTVEEHNQKQALNQISKDYGARQIKLIDEIYNLEKEINVHEGLNEKLFSRIDVMIKEREEK
ncbi:hypothetical protein D0U04_26615 [Bacillus clarus]|uniref:Uncharacterized protein n=1 Tax=Bacillus clarus TaxID=2338372 RepID=A0A090YT22_9BACI|nr:hypothetical protein [Bacillus clarus]KFM95260.1 hypothetical protein DJ93_5826 [Bacillus clarus]RFT62928.1 hypothetical protein D0U04_26615 [Bacillus clarus]